ncbi:MAG: hypothetical protein GTN40_02575 [Candidatus Aenigmarchaeota archaeon]|nr:hypothetical protein [Candidatus Aenigmarchaeota archaeon]
MKKRERREGITIIVDILEEAKDKIRKTHLMYKTNLSFNGLNRYLDALTKSGYIQKDSGIYKTTPEGMEALKDLRGASRVLEEFNKHW